MAQLIVAKNKNGIALGADGKALTFNLQGEMKELQVKRLFQLGSHAAILAGGASESAAMSETLKKFIDDEKLEDIQEIYSAALPILASEYDEYMRKTCEILPVDPLHHIYFILAGYSPSNPSNPFRAYLIWAKKKLPQLDGDEIETAYCAPRRITLELRLNQLGKQNSSLQELLAETKNGLMKLGDTQEEIGPPYQLGIISAKGFELIS